MNHGRIVADLLGAMLEERNGITGTPVQPCAKEILMALSAALRILARDTKRPVVESALLHVSNVAEDSASRL